MKKNRVYALVLFLLLTLIFLVLISLSYGLNVDAGVEVYWIDGDTNGDSCVDIYDFIKVGHAFTSNCYNNTCPSDKSCWGDYTGCTTSGNWNSDADLKQDGRINAFDFNIIGRNFGNGVGC